MFSMEVTKKVQDYIANGPNVDEALTGDIAQDAFEKILEGLATLRAIHEYAASEADCDEDRIRNEVTAKWYEDINDNISEGPGVQ